MGVENITNLSDFQIGLKDLLPAEVLGQVDKLIFISKIAVYIFIGYVLFLIIKQFYGWRRNKRINIMYHRVNEINKKLDLILEKKKVKSEPVKKKKRFWKRLFDKKEKRKNQEKKRKK